MMEQIAEIIPAVKVVTVKGMILRIGNGDDIDIKYSNGKEIYGKFIYLEINEDINNENKLVLITDDNQIKRINISQIEEIDTK